jgi:hypothetical protein
MHTRVSRINMQWLTRIVLSLPDADVSDVTSAREEVAILVERHSHAPVCVVEGLLQHQAAE